MKVYLLQDVPSLGHKGEIKKVALGFAKNFLFPKQLATLANPSLIKQVELKKEKDNKQEEEKKTEAKKLVEKIKAVTVTIPLKFSTEGKEAYAAATPTMIVQALNKKGIKISESQIEFKNPLKEIGDYKVIINLYPEITTELKVTVTREK